jgi:hypothetical protein
MAYKADVDISVFQLPLSFCSLKLVEFPKRSVLLENAIRQCLLREANISLCSGCVQDELCFELIADTVDVAAVCRVLKIVSQIVSASTYELTLRLSSCSSQSDSVVIGSLGDGEFFKLIL